MRKIERKTGKYNDEKEHRLKKKESLGIIILFWFGVGEDEEKG